MPKAPRNMANEPGSGTAETTTNPISENGCTVVWLMLVGPFKKPVMRSELGIALEVSSQCAPAVPGPPLFSTGMKAAVGANSTRNAASASAPV